MRQMIGILVLCMTGLLGFNQATESSFLFFSPEMIQSHLPDYTDEEKVDIERDLEVVRSVCYSKIKPKASGDRPLYLATAGAPGARKSTILERFLESHPEHRSLVYLDPDPRTMKFMVHTYYSQSLSHLAIGTNPDYLSTARKAYEKWQEASNYIVLKLLEEAFSNRQCIAHGTTSTGKSSHAFLDSIRKAGYDVTLLLCYAEDEFRFEALRYRREEQRIYQSKPEDEVQKGWLFPERMQTYFALADTLYLFWSDDLRSPERLAAIVKGNELTILDEEAFNRFADKYERDRVVLSRQGKDLPSWRSILEQRNL